MKRRGKIRNALLLFSIFLLFVGTGSLPSPAMAQSCPSTNSLISDYRFGGNGYDSTGLSSPMALQNVSWEDSNLALNGLYNVDCPNTGYNAIATITCFNFNAFTVSLDFYPTLWGTLMPKPEEEPAGDPPFYNCGFTSNILTGGTSNRWLRIKSSSPSGNSLMLTLNNQPDPNPNNYEHIFLGTSLSPDRWHNVVVSVDVPNKNIVTFLDGLRLEDLKLDSSFELIHSNDTHLAFTDYSNASTFHGQVDNLKVFNYALSAAEIEQLLLIDRTKWADLEFIRRIEGGAFRSAIRRFGENATNNLTFANPASVNSIAATVHIDGFINNGAFPRARVGGYFYGDSNQYGLPGDIFAEVGIGEFISGGLNGYYLITRCFNVDCTSNETLDYRILRSVDPFAEYNLSIYYDQVRHQFAFGIEDVPAYFDPPQQRVGPPILNQWKGISTRVSNTGNDPTKGGYVDAKFDDVYVNDSIESQWVRYDNFDSSALIDRTKWSDSTLEFVREQITDGVYGSALRSYGAFANNNLNFIDAKTVKEFQADLIVKEFINNDAAPQARLMGDFYSYEEGGTLDIHAATGIRHNGTQPVGFYSIVKCTNSDCNLDSEFVLIKYHEYPEATGPDLVGSPHRLSIRWDEASKSFSFGFDGRLTTYPSPSDPPLPAIGGLPERARKGISTRISGIAEGSLEGGYVSAEFVNIATVIDTDGDGVPDALDICPAKPNADQLDTDGDGVGDACDNCPKIANGRLLGTCSNIPTKTCHDDSDCNGNGDEIFLVTENGDFCSKIQEDNDLDGVGDVCDYAEQGGDPTTADSVNYTICVTVDAGIITCTPSHRNTTITCCNGPCTLDPYGKFVQDNMLPSPIHSDTSAFTIKLDSDGKVLPGGDLISDTEVNRTICFDVNLLDYYPAEVLKAAGPSLDCFAVTSCNETDPDLVNGQCQDPPGKCVPIANYTVKNLVLPKLSELNLSVDIDIRPYSQRNLINPLWKGLAGVVPVAILSQSQFDARTEVDRNSLRFGVAGKEDSILRIGGIPACLGFDVDRDGDKDLVCLFGTKKMGDIGPETEKLNMSGRLKAETPRGFVASDSITADIPRCR